MVSAPLRLRYEGEGEFRVVSNYWATKADQEFVIGEVYAMVEHHDRSTASHNHYFAAVQNGFDNLPDHMKGEYPSSEHLRKKALIRCGYRDERDIVLSSKAEAERVAAFLRPMDEYAIVVPVNCVVRVWTAKTQKKSAMDAREFQKSKEDVLTFIDDLLGVERGSTARSEAA